MTKSSCVAVLAVFLLSGCEAINEDEDNTRLSSLSVSGGSLTPGFSSSVKTYSAAVDATTDSTTVTAVAEDSAATVSIRGRAPSYGRSTENVPLAAGSNPISITVVAENGRVQRTYMIDVTRPSPAPGLSVGGSVTGLMGSLTLQINGGDDLVISADGPFTFPTALSDGASYNVTVSSQPSGQQCTVAGGSGTVSGADVADIVVICGEPGTLLVAGTVNGLAGIAVVQLNGANDLLLGRNGTFVFRQMQPDGFGYSVTILTQPEGQTCTISNGSGTIAGDHVIDVEVDCTGAGSLTGSIFDWNWVDPLPQGNVITDLASDGTQIVAVGSSGSVQTSTDGINWTTQDAGTGTFGFSGVAWGNGRFVAVASDGAVATSSDGIDWQSEVLGFYSFTRVVWNGSVFVAVGVDNAISLASIAATSPDGINWSIHEVDPDAGGFSINDIAWNGSLFAAVQFPDSIFTSADGVNWSSSDLGQASSGLQAIASDGSRFVVTDISGAVFTSLDGVTWTQEAVMLSFPPGSSLTWDGARFVASSVATSGDYATSPDGSSWTEHQIALPASGQIVTRFARFGGLNIAAITDGAIYTSADDLSWTTSFSDSLVVLRDVIWHGGQFIAAGFDSTIATSPDGEAWTIRHSISPVVSNLTGITQGGGLYVAVGVGAESQILTSPDAITWTAHTPVMGNLNLSNVAFGNNQFVTVGTAGTILTSPDGMTWTAQAAGLDGTEFLDDVAWNGSLWAVTGYQSTGSTVTTFVATSPDAVNWTKHPFPYLVFLQGLEWNGSMFVAVGNTSIATSTDGVDWSVRNSNVSLEEITWTGSEFIAVGFYPDVLTSPDGMDWSVTRSISGSYSGVASDGSTAVVVGPRGHVLTNANL